MRARSLDKKHSYMILYVMENTKPFVFKFPDDNENRSDAIYQWLNVSMVEYKVQWGFRALNAINMMQGHLLVYSPSEARMKKAMGSMKAGKIYTDKAQELVFNVVTWIRE